MKKYLLIVTTITVAIFISCSPSYAWGPGIHMSIGNAILKWPEIIPVETARLILTHSAAYLYGCLSADIFIGKGSKAKRQHSHNWKTGYELLSKSDGDYLKAYSLGYLSHLAADVIAHNYFVPNMLLSAPSGGKLSHVYIEMVSDRYANWSPLQAGSLFKKANQDADFCLKESMSAKHFSFNIKKMIFRQTIGLMEYKGVTSSIDLSQKAIPALSFESLNKSVVQAHQLVVDLLSNPTEAVATRFDPIGSKNLEEAKLSHSNTSFLNNENSTIDKFPVSEIISSLPSHLSSSSLLK